MNHKIWLRQRVEDVYLRILTLAVSNFIIPNKVAQIAANAYWDAADEMRVKLGIGLPFASLIYLQSLQGAETMYPTNQDRSAVWRQHLKRALSLGRSALDEKFYREESKLVPKRQARPHGSKIHKSKFKTNA